MNCNVQLLFVNNELKAAVNWTGLLPSLQYDNFNEITESLKPGVYTMCLDSMASGTFKIYFDGKQLYEPQHCWDPHAFTNFPRCTFLFLGRPIGDLNQ